MVTIRYLSYYSNITHPLSSRTVTNIKIDVHWHIVQDRERTGEEKRFVQQISGKPSLLETAVGDGNRVLTSLALR